MIRYCSSICFMALLFVAGSSFTGFAAVCSNPGVDGPKAISGIVNSYYPGVSAPAGTTTITVGTIDTSSGGSPDPIAAGDLIMVMQMQDADINSSNGSGYGGSSPGSGYTNLNNSGVYEYAVVSSVAGATITITAPLQNGYRNANYAAGSAGQRRFQVIRTPQYSSASFGGGTVYVAAPWNGVTGGVVAFDVAGNLSWGGSTVEVSGRGFRGGAGRSAGGAAGFNASDYRTTAASNPNGSKGEGIAGTPQFVFTPNSASPANYLTNAAGASTDTGVEGYPYGSRARGAPGNAGGGGSDGNPTANDQNTGGGGGGAYSVGGMGGYGWTPGTPPGSMTGGFGGYSVPMGPGLLTMGGGGGAGSMNNNTGTPGGLSASGGGGGGIVIIRARTVSGSGTINANGTNANNSITNDASGGGGAGGAVLVFATNNGGSLGSLTVNARGGNGGTNTGGGTPHGPGGGGSGGFVALTTAAGVVINVQAGINGTTATSPTSTAEYGSTASSGGYQIYALQPVDIPGAGSNALCSPLLTVSKTTVKAETVRGGTTGYILTVTNASGYGTATGVVLSDLLPGVPSQFTLASTDSITLTGGATRTSISNPTSGATSPAWGTFSIPGGGSAAIRFTVAVPAGTTLDTYQNPGSVSYTNPSAGSPGAAATVSPGDTYYTGGGTLPGSNYISASSTQEDVTIWAPATLSKSFLPASITPGGTSTLAIIIANANSVPLNNAAFTDSYPAGLTNTASPNGNISGAGCFGTVTAASGGASVALSGGVIPAGGSCTVSVNVTFAVAGNYTNTMPAGILTNSRNITNTAPASVTLNQAAIQPPSVTKSFLPALIQTGAVSTLSLTVANGGTTNLTGIAFTDTLTSMQVATPAVFNNSCGGTLTAAAGSGSITLANGSLNAGQTCTITVQVTSSTASAAGGHANTVTGITSTQSGAGPNSNTTHLAVAGTPTIAKAFLPTAIAPGATSTLTFTITNPGSIALTNATFSDNMGSLKIAATGAAGGSCAGAAGNTLNAGTGSIVLSGLTIPASSSCTVTVQVTGTVAGVQTNITNGVSSTETPAPGPQSAASTLTVLFPPQIAKSFAGMIQAGVAGSFSTLSITVTNPNSGTGLTNVSFTDNLTNMVVYTPLAVSNGCGGTLTAAAGGAVVSLSGGTLAAGGNCIITVRIGSSVPSPAGGHPNTISGATSAETGATPGPPDTAYLNVLQAPSITKAFSLYSVPLNTATTLTFTITNPNSIPLTGASFTDTFPLQVTTTNLAQNYIGGARGTCVGAIPSSQVAGNYYATRTFSGFSIPANDSCTIMVDVICSTAKPGTACSNGNYSNTTTGVTTSQTTVGTVSNTATLAVGRVGISKSFSPATMAVGDTSDITFTLDNDSGASRTGTFTDTFPAGMTVAAPIPVSNSCGGTLRDNTNTSLAVGDPGIRLNNVTLANGASCTLVIRVTVSAAGIYNNTTTGFNYGTTGPPSNTAALAVFSRPTIATSFTPAAIDVFGTSTMTFTLTNSNSSVLTTAAFTDPLTGFNATSPAVTGGTCSGVISTPPLAPGATNLNLTVPNLLPGSCTITVPVTSSSEGVYNNTTSGMTADQTGITAGVVSNTATLTVNRLPLQVSKVPNVITASPGTLVIYDIGYSNPNATTSLQSVVITDPVPVYTTYDSASCGSLPPGITSCNVSFTPPPAGLGNGTITWTLGGTLTAGSSGTVRLTVRIQ